LKTSKIKELPILVISKSIEELAVFMKKPVKNHPDNLRGLTCPINLASFDQCCPDMKI
jgi:hypothetical protein